ncbi:MAG: hypothetical protein KJ077_51250 [Anaerolineae bacterium]|nr:hypothetical protein [Anaerolineae bacterium]
MVLITLTTLKLGLLFFWAAWFSLVFLTNLCAGLKALGVLPEPWRFASKNYQAIRDATESYAAPGWLPGLLFAGVILWQGLAVFLFWQAALHSLQSGMLDLDAATPAFAISLGLWAAFMLADEIFKVYDGESTHLLIFLVQLVTLVSLYILPA